MNYKRSVNEYLKTIVKTCVLSVDSSRFLNSPSSHWFPDKQKENKIGPLNAEFRKNDKLGHKIDIMGSKKLNIKSSHKTNSSINSSSDESQEDKKPTKRKIRKDVAEVIELLNL